MRTPSFRVLCAAAILLTVGLSLAVFGQRLISAAQGPDFGTVYDYPDALYGIWKVQHGQPLYESSLSGNFNVMLVNYGFYYFYGEVLDFCGIRDGDVLRLGRFLTLLIALGGMFGHLFTLRTLLGAGQWQRWWWLAVSSVLMFWFAFTNWFVFSVRCDLPAVVATVWALAFYLRFGIGETSADVCGAGKRTAVLALVSVLFAAAWSFKQVYIWSFSALVLWELLHGSWGRLMALAGPFAMIVLTSLWVGGRLYWENTLVIPAVNPFLPVLILQQTAKAVLAYPFIFLFGALGVLWGLRRVTAGGFRPGTLFASLRADGEPRLTALVVAAVGATAMNVLTFGRVGGLREHIFEGASALTVLAVVTFVALVDAGETRGDRRTGNRWMGLAGACFLVASLLPLGQLFAYGALNTGIGRLHADFVPRPPSLFDHEGDYERLQSLSAIVEKLPKPCLNFGILALPWYATSNQYPAFIINSDVYYHLQRRGLLRDGGWQSIYRNHRVRSLLLDGDDTVLVADVLQHGFRVAPLAPELSSFSGQAASVAGGHRLVVLVAQEGGTPPAAR